MVDSESDSESNSLEKGKIDEMVVGGVVVMMDSRESVELPKSDSSSSLHSCKFFSHPSTVLTSN